MLSALLSLGLSAAEQKVRDRRSARIEIGVLDSCILNGSSRGVEPRVQIILRTPISTSPATKRAKAGCWLLLVIVDRSFRGPCAKMAVSAMIAGVQSSVLNRSDLGVTAAQYRGASET
jgi:hypothetical protein